MDVVEDKVQEWVRRPLMVMVSAWKWQQGQVWDSFKVESSNLRVEEELSLSIGRVLNVLEGR